MAVATTDQQHHARATGDRIGLIGRAAAAAIALYVGFTLSVGPWRTVEAALSLATLHLLGVDDATRWGDQIVLLGDPGRSFSADIGPWCSSAGVVLAFAAVATIVARGDRRRRARAFLRGSGVVVFANLVRIVATVCVGAWSGPQHIEHFHDSVATTFAVLFVLTGLAVFTTTLLGSRRTSRSDRLGDHRDRYVVGE